MRPFRALRSLLLLTLLGGLLLVPALLVPSWAIADDKVGELPRYRLGILAFRSLEHTTARWQATVDALNAVLSEGQLELVPLSQDQMNEAVARGRLDYVFTQPEHYVLLRGRYGLAALTTLMPLANGRPVTQFGGVIFTRHNHPYVHRIEDIVGKHVIAVQEHSLGGFRMQQWELMKAGIRLPDDVEQLDFTGQPQDKTVQAILNGQGDVGFVRTGVLEAMSAEGKIRLDQLRIINQQPADLFPQLLSTSLYPEWPLAALRGTPEHINKALTLALLNLRPDSAAARTGQYYGFSPPGDYTPLEAVLLRLRVHPNRLDGFDYQDVWAKYGLPIAGALGCLLLLALAAVWQLRRDRLQIRAAAHERNLLLSSLGEGVYGVNRQGICTFINPAALRMLGLSRDEVVGQHQHLLFHHHHPDGTPYPEADCPIHHTLYSGLPTRGEESFIDRQGRHFPVRFDATPICEDDRVIGAVVCFQDISEAKQAEEALRLAAVAFETQEAIVITDRQSRILRVNQAFSQVTGYSASEAIGQTPALLKSGRHDAGFYRQMWDELQLHGRWQGEVWNRRKNGEVYPEWLTITAVRDPAGEVCHYVAAFLDISERKQAEAQLEYMTLYDSLTGLANRRLFMDRLNQMLGSQRRSHGIGALLFIDLDNFRHINDLFGHSHGDAILIEIAQRLRGELGEDVTIARPGGDDFMVLLDGIGSTITEVAAHVEDRAERLLARLSEPYPLLQAHQHCTASIGITLVQGMHTRADDLVKQAELAMYQAKEHGRNAVRFFDPAVQEAVASRLSLEVDLRLAIKQAEFSLFYQPQVDAQGRIVGAEALLRWQHPQRGMVSPAQFIPFAENSGLIVPIGTWVLEEACRQLVMWQDHPLHQHWTLAVNISARQFHQPDFVERVHRIVIESGVDPRYLKLELTESLLVEDIDDTIRKMDALRSLGLSLSLDDFGTGYSSLSYLKRLPLSQLKIDQSFVRDIGHDANDDTIVRAIIGLADNLGLSVIAEGVETATQRTLLTGWGCRHFQGYHFYRPLPEEQLNALRSSISTSESP